VKPVGDNQPAKANKTEPVVAPAKANQTAPATTPNNTSGAVNINQVKPGQFDRNKTPDSFPHTSPDTVEDHHVIEPVPQPVIPKPTPATPVNNTKPAMPAQPAPVKPVPVPTPTPAKPVQPTQPVKPAQPVVQPPKPV